VWPIESSLVTMGFVYGDVARDEEGQDVMSPQRSLGVL